MTGTQSILENEVLESLSFIFGGRAEFTIKNLSSNNEFKYKVSKCQKNEKIYYVCVKVSAEWAYAGYILKNNDGSYRYNKGKNGTMEKDEPAIKGLIYAICKGDNPLPRPMVLRHHGKCGCCGKKLDDNESVSRGFGPVCWKKLNKVAKPAVQSLF